MFIEKHFQVSVARADLNGDNFRDINALSIYVYSRLDS